MKRDDSTAQTEQHTISDNDAQLKFMVRPSTDDRDIVGEVLNGEYYRRALSSLGPGSAVIDVGAHIGTFTVASGARGARVLALEPIPANYQLLCANVAANDLGSTVEALQVAAWSCEEPRALPVAHDSTGGSSFYYWDKTATGTEVECARLDDLMDRAGIPVCDVLKMDCEGAEVEILRSLSEEAWQRIRLIVAEYHLFADYSLEQLQELFTDHGFAVITHSDAPSKGILGYVYAVRSSAGTATLERPEPFPLLDAQFRDSTLTRVPVIGALWRWFRRPVHELIVYYLNQALAVENQRYEQLYLQLQAIREKLDWIVERRQL